MTDIELKKDLESKISAYYFKTTFFKRDFCVYYRRSFDDLFLYYRACKVTEKQLLRVLINNDFQAAVCTDIHKVVFMKKTNKLYDFWKTVSRAGEGYSISKTTKNTKYTAKYINNLYNQIQEDAN